MSACLAGVSCEEVVLEEEQYSAGVTVILFILLEQDPVRPFEQAKLPLSFVDRFGDASAHELAALLHLHDALVNGVGLGDTELGEQVGGLLPELGYAGLLECCEIGDLGFGEAAVRGVDVLELLEDPDEVLARVVNVTLAGGDDPFLVG